MMFLRLLCLLSGVLVLVVPPAMLYPTGAVTPDTAKAALILAGLVLASSGFFFIGMAGHRMRRSVPLRSLAALLLAVPFAASLAVMWRGGSPAELWACSLMLSFVLVLYVTIVWPVVRAQGHRPLRAREAREPQLGTLPRG